MSTSLDAVLCALEGWLDATPDPSEPIELEQAMSMTAAMVSERQLCFVALEEAVSECGGFPKENPALQSLVSEIAERESRWMAMLQAFHHKSQQQLHSRQRLRQLGSRAQPDPRFAPGKTHVLG